MKKLLLFVLTVTLISANSLNSQVKLTISSDSSEYSYGQPILLTIKILNNSDSTFLYYSCPGGVYKFDDFYIDHYIVCAIDMPFPLLPGRSVTWNWKIDPVLQGIPNKDGLHTIVGYYGQLMSDTIFIIAPVYYGGRIRVGYLKNLESDINKIKDSLNVSVINRDDLSEEITEIWQIKGHLIDSVISKYKNDQRFKYVERDVRISLESITTSIENSLPEKSVKEFETSDAYPNPFNSSTNFYIEVKSEQNILIELFNTLGQKVNTIFNGRIPANFKNYFTVNLDSYSSGIYLIFVRSENNTFARKIFLMK